MTVRIRGLAGTASMVALALVVPLGLLSASGQRGSGPVAAADVQTPAPSVPATPSAPVTLAVTPGGADLPVTTEIGTTVTNGKITDVVLADSAGKRIDGSMRADGSSWVPAAPLEHAKAYTANVTATGADGSTATATMSFTTMKRPGGTRVGTGLYLFTGRTYGVAMPVAVEFESDIPVEARASVVKRLFVTSDPPQAGGWRWFGARQVLYRPAQYWQPGTKVTVRAALSGHPIGKRYGDSDRSASVLIGRKLTIEVDNATKQMNVFKDDALLRTMPVSLGKAKTPSSSGTMVIMAKEEQTVFDTTATDGADGYRIDIAFAQRLTWGGQFIHAAPWSVRDQGVRNVSHGCVNLATANARWLFEETLVGDPVTVKGTERGLDPGDGWTAWNVPWSEYTA